MTLITIPGSSEPARDDQPPLMTPGGHDATSLELRWLRLRLDALLASRRLGGLTIAEQAECDMLRNREGELLAKR
jgi:hypothetical protein